MEKIVGQVFRGGEVTLDGREFERCTFDDVDMHWEGVGNVSLPPGNLIRNVRLKFGAGPRATIDLLRQLNAIGLSDSVELVIDHIRSSPAAKVN